LHVIDPDSYKVVWQTLTLNLFCSFRGTGMGEIALIHYSITLSLPLITQCYKYFWCCVGKKLKRCENGGCFPPVKDDPRTSLICPRCMQCIILAIFSARTLTRLSFKILQLFCLYLKGRRPSLNRQQKRENKNNTGQYYRVTDT
jgi:hypothetical protein